MQPESEGKVPEGYSSTSFINNGTHTLFVFLSLPFFWFLLFPLYVCLLSPFNPVRLVVTPGTMPASLLSPWDFPDKDTGGGCPLLLQGNLPDPGIEPTSRVSRALAGGFFPTGAPWEAPYCRAPRALSSAVSPGALPRRDGIGSGSPWRPSLVRLPSAGCWPWPRAPITAWFPTPAGGPPTLPSSAQICSPSWFPASADDLSLLRATLGRNQVLWKSVFLCPAAIQVLLVGPPLVSLPAP